MSNVRTVAIVNNIKLPIDASVKEAFSVAERKFRKCGYSVKDFFVYKRSIDARHKDDIRFVYSIAAVGEFSALAANPDFTVIEPVGIDPEIGTERLMAPPVVVGSGPCGMFAALLLAEMGYTPTVIERGDPISERKIAVDKFNRLRTLDCESNIQFGAGGAGTFSDGKLVTRINDPLTNYVIERFIEFGAPADIRYIAKPHIGTDVLSVIVEKMLARIEELGGRVLYRTKLLSFNTDGSRITSVLTTRGEIKTDAVILAIGHSARDTYEYLIERGVGIECKPFSVGMRIEHLADDIDRAMYGNFAGNPLLGHAEYNLSFDTKNRGVYTFCMCPGGEVVAAASECDSVVVNGMSYNARDGRNSNCAVVCSVFREDYGNTPSRAIEFQRRIERAAYTAGGKDYSAPIITVGDFLGGECKSTPSRVMPTYMNSVGVRLASPSEYLPRFVTEPIKNALRYFDRKIEGFAASDAVLSGAETRTSAPIRILRNNDTRLALGFDNLYPSGEGAGYAGGITSASVDGLRSAMALMKIYSPHK